TTPPPLALSAEQPTPGKGAELGRPAGAVQRVRHRGERTQRVDPGLADFTHDVDAHRAEPPPSHARLKPAKEPCELVTDQAVGLRERESPDPEIADLREDDASVAIDRADQGAIDRAPDVDREIVPRSKHVVRADGNVVDRSERRHVGGEHGITVLAQRRTEGPEIRLIRLILDAWPLLGQLRGLSQKLLLLRALLEAPDLLDPDGIQIEAGLDSRKLIGFGHPWSHAEARRPRVDARLLSDLSLRPRRTLGRGDLGDSGRLRRLLEGIGLGGPRPWNRDRLIGPRTRAGLTDVRPGRPAGPLDRWWLNLRKQLGG